MSTFKIDCHVFNFTTALNAYVSRKSMRGFINIRSIVEFLLSSRNIEHKAIFRLFISVPIKKRKANGNWILQLRDF
jgi:hypothetical protein